MNGAATQIASRQFDDDYFRLPCSLLPPLLGRREGCLPSVALLAEEGGEESPFLGVHGEDVRVHAPPPFAVQASPGFQTCQPAWQRW